MTNPTDERDRRLEAIARRTLEIPTLRKRGSDRLDFHEVSVWSLLEALRRAHDAGREQAPGTAVCRALDAYAHNIYDEVGADLAVIVEQARQAIGTSNAVPPSGVCPRCGEDDADRLIWDEAGESVTCQRCGTNYTIHRIS